MIKPTRYERLGKCYVAYDASGKPCGFLVPVKSIKTANKY